MIPVTEILRLWSNCGPRVSSTLLNLICCHHPCHQEFARITYICNDVCGWSGGWELGFMLFTVSRMRNPVDIGGVFSVAALGERDLDLKAPSIFCVLWGLHLSKGTLRWFQLQRTLCWLFPVIQTWITVLYNYIDFTKLGRLEDAGWLYRKQRGRGSS